jgi:hypothetical protein
MKLYLKVTSSGLIPIYDSDFEEKKKLKIGSTVLADVKQPRNYEHHKKFFALMRLVMDNMPEELTSRYPTTDNLLTEIKFQTGHYDTHYTLSGRETYVPRSISFESMTQDEFNEFYDKTIDVVIKWFLPYNNRQELMQEITNYL